jgi:hypothetical protein
MAVASGAPLAGTPTGAEPPRPGAISAAMAYFDGETICARRLSAFRYAWPPGHPASQRLPAGTASRPMARARCTASWRLCAPSLRYTCRRWVLTVFAET